MIKRILYVLVTVFTLYMGGMYWSPALIILFFIEVSMFVLSYLYAFYIIHKIDIEIQLEHPIIQKNHPTKAYIIITNRSILPINNFILDVAFKQSLVTREKAKWEHYTGSIGSRNNITIELNIDSKLCGTIEILVGQICIHDYLSLFNEKRKYTTHKEILVLPTEEKLSILSGADLQETETLHIYKNAFDTNMSDFNPREYVPGDSIRHIHWKLTAKTQTFWTKDYYDEESQVAMLALNLYNEGDIPSIQWDAFIEITSAFSLGLLAKKVSHFIVWFDLIENRLHKHLVQNKTDYVDMITYLIMTLKHSKQGFVVSNTDMVNALCLDTNLQVSYKQKALLQFTAHNYKEEIKETWIQI